MMFRKDARRMAAALDKARELSRKEPPVDWSEAEWKSLMAAAVAQKIVGKEEREEPHRKAAYWKPALAYGGAALIMVGFIGYALRNSFFRPAASPESYAQADRRKDMSPASPAPETAPPVSAGGIAKSVDAVAANPAPSVILAGKAAAESGRSKGSAVLVESPTQDTVTISFVSPESGLRIVWVLNRNFEWKGESQ